MLYNYLTEDALNKSDNQFTTTKTAFNKENRATDPRVETFKNAVEVLRKLRNREKKDFK